MDDPTPYRDLFRDANLPLPKLAELAGVNVNTLRSMSVGRTRPRPSTRRKLAAALRAHSATLEALARSLE